MWVSSLDPSVGLCFCNNLCTAAQTVAKRLFSGRAAACIGQWQKWLNFYDVLGIDPFLEAFEDKVPVLQVFMHQVRIGELSANENQTRS